MPRWSLALLAGFVALPAFAQKDPAAALATMTAGDGLKVELFASEPMLINPTSIDVDHKGRVWVAEAVNYRRKPPYNRPMLRKEGDRIVVLTDKDGDGKADESTVFYQGEDLYGPLSVLVIPTNGGKSLRVLVAQSPDILEFTCKDADKPVADGPPKKFLTGFGGIDHDHGVHGLHLGPDGKLYFTVGDGGLTGLQSSDGKGKKWVSNTTDVQKGTVWRCDLDGKNVELIAHNFRNNYEACVDSFGEIWCSDNDDDGNQQTRICFVMPGGNYGYGPRGPGQSHWHEEQPGIVHKTLRTGFGSPTGIQFYEGSLLPKQYHNALLHCDAGPREVRAFTRKPKGAGYELDKAVILTSSDTWFRPSDVCTAPDGSVFVADWYDPGVGGHGMGDWTRGRIYRLTPKDHKGYKVPEVKLDTQEGFADAFRSPNMTTRHMASSKLRAAAEVVLEAMKKGDKDAKLKDATELLDPDFTGPLKLREAAAHIQARWLWATCLANKGGWNDTPMFNAVGQFCDALRSAKKNDSLPNALVRIDRDLGDNNVVLFFEEMLLPTEVLPKSKFHNVGDRYKFDPKAFAEELGPTPAIRRELLLTLRNVDVKVATPAFYALAELYDGKDIFYRAALNIACGTDPVRRDAILADFEKHFPEWNYKTADLVWELRPKSMLPKMEKLIGDPKLTAAQKARIVDIMASSDDERVGKTLLDLLVVDTPPEIRAKIIDQMRLFLPTKWAGLRKTAKDELYGNACMLIRSEQARTDGLKFAAVTGMEQVITDVYKCVFDDKLPMEDRVLAAHVLGSIPEVRAVDGLNTMATAAVGSNTKWDTRIRIAAVESLGQLVGRREDKIGPAALKSLQDCLSLSDTPAEFRIATLSALAGSRAGTQWLIKQKEDGKLAESLTGDVGRLLRNSPHQDLRNKAMILFPPAGKLDPKKLPAIGVLAARKGNAENGKAVLAKSLTGEAQCLKCHTIRGTGGSIGPDLSMIGKKGSKENLYDSLLTPSKAVADQYQSWRIDSEDGQSITGLLVEETPARITVRDANGKDYTFNTKDVRKQKDAKSIMPEDVIKAFSEDELIDVVEYLMTLQTPSLTPDLWNVAGPFSSKGDKDLDVDFGPEKGAFDDRATFKTTGTAIGWRTVRGDSKGYFDLAAFHGKDSPNSLSYLARTIESPTDQEVTILLGTDDGCRLWVNGEKVFGHENHFAATPAKDSVKVKLKKGANAVLLKVNNGDNPHGFYFTIEGGTDLKLGK